MIYAKKITLSILIAIFISIGGIGFVESTEKNDPLLECIDNTEGWPTYLKISGDNPFVIRFPVKPIFEDYDDVIIYTAVDTYVFPTAVYGLRFYKNSMIPEDPYDIFDEVLKSRSTSPNILLSKKVSTYENGHYILDTLSKTKDLKVFRKDRTIVTAQNVYCLSTIFFPHSPENHDYFINSFKIYN